MDVTCEVTGWGYNENIRWIKRLPVNMSELQIQDIHIREEPIMKKKMSAILMTLVLAANLMPLNVLAEDNAVVEQPVAESQSAAEAEAAAKAAAEAEAAAKAAAEAEAAAKAAAEAEAAATPEATAEPTEAPVATEEPVSTPNVTTAPTAEPEVTVSPEVTIQPSEEPTAEPVATPEATVQPSEEPMATPEVTAEPVATPEATVQPSEEPMATPEVTAEPTTTPEVTEEPTEVPTTTPEETATPEPTATPVVERTVNIYCTASEIEIGDTVVLKSELTGFEGANIQYCWQWYVADANGNMDWRDAPGGSGDTYSFVMTEELVNCEWRLLVIAD